MVLRVVGVVSSCMKVSSAQASHVSVLDQPFQDLAQIHGTWLFCGAQLGLRTSIINHTVLLTDPTIL